MNDYRKAMALVVTVVLIGVILVLVNPAEIRNDLSTPDPELERPEPAPVVTPSVPVHADTMRDAFRLAGEAVWMLVPAKERNRTQPAGVGVMLDRGIFIAAYHGPGEIGRLSSMQAVRGGKVLDLALLARVPDVKLAIYAPARPDVPGVVLDDGSGSQPGDPLILVEAAFEAGPVPLDFGQTIVGARFYHEHSPGLAAWESIRFQRGPGRQRPALLFTRQGALAGLQVLPEGRDVFEESGGFATALGTAHLLWALDTLERNGRLVRGYVGLRLKEADPGDTWQLRLSTTGRTVDQIVTGSPADLAGLKAGDQLVEVNGAPLNGPGDWRRLVYYSVPGTRIALKYLRGEELRETVVTVIEHPQGR
jgi:hypothetical protein